jgi:hypothetical protein
MSRFAQILTFFGLSLFVTASVYAFDVQIGTQHFTDGQGIELGTYETAVASQPAPFDQFYGSDPDGPNFSASWTFNFAPGSYSSASLTFGIFDHDSQAPGDQVNSFQLNGNDLTSLLNTAFESHGGTQEEYNIYTIDIPASDLASLSSGVALFDLVLQGPGLFGAPLDSYPTTASLLDFNGAGLDFARLSVAPLPEPSTLLLLGTGLAGIGLLRRRFKKQI